MLQRSARSVGSSVMRDRKVGAVGDVFGAVRREGRWGGVRRAATAESGDWLFLLRA
jgi:hypothetical protein